MEIDIYCCLCRNKVSVEVASPDGWERVDDIDIEDALCPEHSIIQDFIGSQCSGCAGKWTDCTLWSSFAYEGRRCLSDADFEKIGVGICPKRVNGTILFKDNKVEDVDLSEMPSNVAGEAFVKAIREYWERNFKDE